MDEGVEELKQNLNIPRPQSTAHQGFISKVTSQRTEFRCENPTDSSIQEEDLDENQVYANHSPKFKQQNQYTMMDQSMAQTSMDAIDEQDFDEFGPPVIANKNPNETLGANPNQY